MANTTVFTVKGSGGVTVSRQDASTFIVDGAAIQGSSSSGFNPYYGTCTTTASDVTKTVSCVGFTLTTGAVISVLFTRGHSTPAGMKLNVNGTGVKNAYYKGVAIKGDSVRAQGTYTFVYTGSNYEMITPPIYTTAPAYASHIYANPSKKFYDFVTRSKISNDCTVNTVTTGWSYGYYGTGGGGSETVDITITEDDDWTVAVWVFLPAGVTLNNTLVPAIQFGSYSMSLVRSSTSNDIYLSCPSFLSNNYSTKLTYGQWTHLAVVRHGSGMSASAYVNGSRQTTGLSLSDNVISFDNIHISSWLYIGEIIIAKEAIWTSNFTPNSTPL